MKLGIVLLIVLVAPACAARVGAKGQGAQQAVWVCHGNRNPRWQKVAAPAANGHRRHGDPVSTSPRRDGAACER
jgi:hypothetical protein